MEASLPALPHSADSHDCHGAPSSKSMLWFNVTCLCVCWEHNRFAPASMHEGLSSLARTRSIYVVLITGDKKPCNSKQRLMEQYHKVRNGFYLVKQLIPFHHSGIFSNIFLELT
uniref:Uncharacterized protein n=1 Tax=Terrapene triunguis TaxID=2587831 RepID=A0A674I3H4_9SAUR